MHLDSLTEREISQTPNFNNLNNCHLVSVAVILR